MNKKTSSRGKRKPGPSGRDLGLASNDAGKGDAARNCFSSDYKNNFDEIAWTPKDGTAPRRFKKVYGRPAADHTFPPLVN